MKHCEDIMTQNTSNRNPVLYAVVMGLALALMGGMWWIYKTVQGTPLQSSAPTCASASGRIWSNVVLYKDAGCSSELATVIGGKDGKVKLRYPDGSEEWKERGVASSQYVKSADPAIAAKQWVEPQ